MTPIYDIRQKILVVDDRRENLLALKKVLQDIDVDLIEATNGNEALASTLEHDFALAIIDVMMPGMSGYELAALLRNDKKTKLLPIIFVTAMSPDEEKLKEGYFVGGIDYIFKPYMPEIIQSKVRIFLALDKYRNEIEHHREHLERTVKERTEELKQTVIELKKVNRIRSVLSETNQSIVRIRERDELFQAITRIIYEIGGFKMVIIRFADSKRTKLIPQYYRGVKPGDVSRLNIDLNDPSCKGLPSSEAFLTGLPQIDAEAKLLKRDPELLDGTKEHPIMSHGAFPIFLDGKVIGVICLLTDQQDFFTADEMNLLKELTTDVSFALQYLEDEKKRKKAEEKLSESEYLQQAILGSSPAGIALFRNRKLEWCNELWEKTFGYPMDDIRGSTSRIFFTTDEDYHRVGQQLYETLEYGDILEIEVTNKRKDGSVFPSLIKATRLKDVRNESLVIIILIDITEKHKAEQELIEARKKAEESDRLKTAFLQNLSHEIRTPMNGIIGFSELLSDPTISVEDHEKFTRIISKECHQLLGVITDIVEISRIETGEIDTYELKTPVNQLLTSLKDRFIPAANEKNLGLELVLGLPDEQSVILSDESKLRQVLEKLIMNAIKFTNTGGIRFGYDNKDCDYLQFFIQDSGIGIPIERQSKIFDRFVQADSYIAPAFGGTGLGLSISKSYIESMGGRIWVDSSPEEGTVFYFTIPYKQVEEEKRTPSEKPGTGKKKSALPDKCKIMVVEDEYDNFEYLRILLEHKNIQVLHAENGRDGLRIFQEEPDIDLVLMDIKLPDINGLEVTKAILQINHAVPVIAQTAYNDPDTRRHVLEAGCTDFIAKPINPRNLIEKITKALGG